MSDPRPGHLYDPQDPSEYIKDELGTEEGWNAHKQKDMIDSLFGLSPRQLLEQLNKKQ